MCKPQAKVSIHAPREGRDACMRELLKWFGVSIHAPREGRDTGYSNMFYCM